MTLCLTVVLSQTVHSPSGGLSEWAIRREFLEASRRLLEATGAIDLFHFQVIRAATIQYVSIAGTTPAIVEVSIGVLDLWQDMARVIHTISTDTGGALLSASIGLVKLRPFGSHTASMQEMSAFLVRVPLWTREMPSESRELLQTVALPMSSPSKSPVTWAYRAVVK